MALLVPDRTMEQLRHAQKPPVQTTAYVRFVNRRIGGYLAALAYEHGWTPNALTALSGALSLTGTVLIALVPPSVPLGVAAALLLLAGFAFDSADGQLARLRGGGSVAGEWLDHVLDAAKACLLHSAVLVSLVRFRPDASTLEHAVPLVFLTATVVLTFAAMLRDQLVAARAQHQAPAPGDSVARGLALLPIDHGVLCLTFLLFGLPMVFLAVYGALAVLHVVFLARLLVRTYRTLAA